MTDGFRTLDFDEYHRVELPRLMAQGREALAAEEASRRGSLGLRIDEGSAFTYQPRDGRLEIVPGDEAAEVVVGLDSESWEGS